MASRGAGQIGSRRLAAKRVVVTGAARGIGAQIARTFATEGAELALLDVLGDEVGKVAADLGAWSARVDLADPAQVATVLDTTFDVLGGVDVLVNNAGILRFAPLLEITVEDWDATFAVNARATLLTIQAAARRMITDGTRGTIVNMASMGGKVGSPAQAHYAASKAAVISLTRVAAIELGEHGITVNCICPGYVLTEMGAATRTAEKIAQWSAKSPLGRLAQPEDVAAMALFLASDEASYCTGQAFNVTGGMIMH